MTHDPFEAAHRLAPVPARDGGREDWVRHYAAQALATYAVFTEALRTVPRDPEPGSRPDLGWLSMLGVAATAAAVVLTTVPEDVPHNLYDLNPDGGALNGEWEHFLVGRLDQLGVNPADIDPRYQATDFRSPTAASRAGQE